MYIKTVQQLIVKREARQLWWADPNLLPDMQALNRELIIHHHFALHQEFIISLCLISR